MAKRSTPNSAPANGPTSTPSLARSRRQKPEDLSGKQASRNKNERRTSISSRDFVSSCEFLARAFLITPSCFPAFLRNFSFSRRVKGAWWPSRSSKSPSVPNDRGRFDSYPLRLHISQESRKPRNSAKPRQENNPIFSSLSCVPAFLRDSFPGPKGGDRVCRVNRFAL